jgi:hypothetical protein
MPRPRRAFTCFAAQLALLLASVAGAHTAHAYDEQASLDLALGYGALAANDRLPRHLLAIDAGGAVGLTDWLVARVGVGYGGLLGDAQTRNVGRGRLELAYLLDVLQWVPFFGVGGGLWALDGPSGLGLRPEGHLWFGVDYLASRTWTYGVDLRSGVLWQRGDVVSWTECQVRLSRNFELF